MDKIKKIISLSLFALATVCASGQESSAAYNVLKLPASSRVAAMGGENISQIDDGPWAGWANPALYSSVSSRSLGLGFMTYAADSKWLGAQYVQAAGERHTWAVTAQYMGYGSMDETDADGTVVGSFSPKDIVFGGGYSYLLSDRWAGGASLKMVTSSYADFSAFALAVDLGVNYYDEERDFSFSAVARNVGAQIKSFDGRTEKVPFCLQAGFTKGIAHAPVRFSVTATDLTRWKSTDYLNPDGEKLGFGKKLLNHFVVGLEVQPIDAFYLSAGYNFRRAYELKAAGSAHGAGLSFGGGLQLRKFKAGVSYAKYHVSVSSLMFNVAYTL